MRNQATLACLTIALAIGSHSPGIAQAAKPTAPVAAPAGKCAALANDWRSIEIALANNSVDSATDNSAPRATMRAAEDTMTYSKAQIVLRLMEVNRCALPDRPPLPGTFLLEALSCKTARMKATIEQVRAGIPECDQANWKGGKG